MLNWLDRYYISKGIRGNVRIQSQINAGKPTPGIWLVTLSENPDNLLELIPADMLLKREAYDACPLIVGMADGKQEAMELVQKIIEKTYKKTGSFRVREFLENR